MWQGRGVGQGPIVGEPRWAASPHRAMTLGAWCATVAPHGWKADPFSPRRGGRIAGRGRRSPGRPRYAGAAGQGGACHTPGGCATRRRRLANAPSARKPIEHFPCVGPGGPAVGPRADSATRTGHPNPVVDIPRAGDRGGQRARSSEPGAAGDAADACSSGGGGDTPTTGSRSGVPGGTANARGPASGRGTRPLHADGTDDLPTRGTRAPRRGRPRPAAVPDLGCQDAPCCRPRHCRAGA